MPAPVSPPPVLPSWFLALPVFWRLLLGGLLFAIAYVLGSQIGFYHWAIGAWIPFLVLWMTPTRYWPALYLAQLVAAVANGAIIGHVSGDEDMVFLRAWPGPVQFFIGNFIHPLLSMIGPWIMRRQGLTPTQKVRPNALLWLHLAALATALPLALKDLAYVLYEGRIGDTRHNVVAFFHELGGPGDWLLLSEFGVSHLLGAFIGMMITLPIAWWWFSRRLERDNGAVLRAGAQWLLPLLFAYMLLMWWSQGSEFAELLRLLLLSTVVVFSIRYGWRGAALSVFVTSLAIGIEDHLGFNLHNPVWQQLFIAIMGAMALMFGSALDELRARNQELDIARHKFDLLSARLQAAASRNVEAEEREKRALAADLHDEFGQTLIALQSHLAVALPLLDEHGPAALGEGLQQSMRRMRRHVTDTLESLRPASLDALGLFGAIDRGALRELAELEGLDYQVDLHGDARLLSRLNDAMRMAAYRVVQGAVTNVIRHAQASQCRVRLRINTRGGMLCLLITVDDDGLGRSALLRRGHGLTGLQDLLLALGGVLHIRDLQPGLRLHALLRQPLANTQGA